ncbi:Aldo/keto reductase [Hyella patelloides LEGE 07179]|uniref:Aldo/keto reductase n=1 Tax=Hyella patelloides LEGE 07179 TaxID=945734 RepID=A0A563VNN7_9CYAN|nr:aldo/keto reductase [Hyella patelloides]VEP12977.1 Aldo/keto reductase [Hyella patelloides LEGE 07179]
MSGKTNRRNFILGSVAAATAIGYKAVSHKPQPTIAVSEIPSSMPERILGKTNISLPVLGLGGAGQTPISKRGQDKEAIALIEKALELGIRYFDTAEMYGISEQQFGQVLPSYRDSIYINSKTNARDYDGAWRHLEKSLKLLKTDYLDCWQMHHLSVSEELEQIFGKNGAIKAVEEAKEQGIIKFSGVTGHYEPDVIVKALQRYDFDTILISLNAADIHHPRPFSTTVLPVAQAKNVGVIAMKVPAYGRLFKPNLLSGMEQAMGYSLSLPGVHGCVIAAENPEQLESNVKVAQNYQALTQAQMQDIEKLTANAGEDGSFFRNWG